LVKIGPLSIVLPKQYHSNPAIFSKINKDSTVILTIVGTKFELYDTEIEAVGLIESIK
jgi:hypothetical protein